MYILDIFNFHNFVDWVWKTLLEKESPQFPGKNASSIVDLNLQPYTHTVTVISK